MSALRLRDPCDQRWEELEPRGTGRHCARCQRVVLDLTGMTEPRAVAHVLLLGGREPCGRLGVDAERAAVFSRERARRRGKLSLIAAALSAACSPSPAAPLPGATSPAHTASQVACQPVATVGVEQRPTVAIPPSFVTTDRTHDRDGDGVVDDADDCPDTPGEPFILGCPPTRQVVQVSLGAVTILRRPQFAAQRATIDEASGRILDEVAKLLRENPGIGHVFVDGHGDASEPYGLSLARAVAVVEYLEKRGVPSGVLEARGIGTIRPLASNGTAEGRAQNRRVEFEIAGP